MSYFISINDLLGGAILGQTAVRLPLESDPVDIVTPAVGCVVHVYLRGTTTPVNVYSASDGSGSVATQPITTDQDGSVITSPGVLGYVAQPAALDVAVSGGPLASPRTIPIGVPALASASVTLAGGVATIANAAITANAIVKVWNIGTGGTVGALSVTLNAGVGFSIHSTSGSDTSKVYYEIISL